MLVFISWSGDRSRYVAQVLRTWLKDVIQQLEPWMSSEDIRQGARWNIDVAQKLQDASFGILCLTGDNLTEPWVLFEAGALAKTLDQSHVCPYLVDLKPSDLRGPLVQFHAAQATEIDTHKLVHSINKAFGPSALPESQVDRAIERWWPDLHKALEQIPLPRSKLPQPRSERDLVEELVERVRRIELEPLWRVIEKPHSISPISLPKNLFEGEEVAKLLERVNELGKADDPNATVWSESHLDPAADELDGLWSTRWIGGAAGQEWMPGIARVQVYGKFLYGITHDITQADCLIAARRLNGNRLAGRYINLAAPQEVLEWAGRVIDKNRIDGYWKQGRWDLRRGETTY